MRRSVLGLALVVASFAGTVTAVPVRAATQMLPDLAMARLRAFSIRVVGDQTRLRFTAIIVNQGVGRFEVRGSRPDTATAEMAVTQRIYNDDGSSTQIPTDAVMYWAGDGHTHWHVRNLERYVLSPLGGAGDRIGAKRGFCFFDNRRWNLELPGAPQSAFYLPASVCANDEPNARHAKAGLSVGWGDRYGASLPGQYVDITGLPDGDYRLTATADASHRFTELDATNNSTSTDLHISGTTLTVIG